MYMEYYGLSADPFRLSPDHGFCLRHASFARARAYMQYALQRKEGFVVITGAPGTGKTTLIDDLLADASAGNFHVARLASAQLGADDLLRMVGYAFGIVADGREKSLLLHRLAERFGANHRVGRRPLLIVDEAQGLSHDALEELRLLTNLRSGSDPLLQIFLVGQEELREMVNSPVLEQLNQRVIASCQLSPLKPQEVAAYVRHRLEVAGWKGRPRFEAEMLPDLARFSKGVPRRINHICSRLLLHGMLEERELLTGDDLRLVMVELESENYVDGVIPSNVELGDFDPEDLSVLSGGGGDEKGVGARLVAADAIATEGKRQERPEPQPQVAPSPAPKDAGEEPAPESSAEAAGEEEVVRPPQAQAGDKDPVVEEAAETPPPEPEKEKEVPVSSPKAPAVQEVRAQASGGKDADPGTEEGEDARASGHPAAWGLASTLILVMALFMTVLVSAPEYEFRRLVKADTWGDHSVGRLRASLSSWTGGAWPLSGTTAADGEEVRRLRIMSVPGGIAGPGDGVNRQLVRVDLSD